MKLLQLTFKPVELCRALDSREGVRSSEANGT